ncbi:siphovirus Gp157 family protein [Clostridium culturomicium]|uniref:siphovirus Gp157 family protein n=1 Tax=Clostridium culturomicium TaxID=1499683 RepID=UPI003857EF04
MKLYELTQNYMNLQELLEDPEIPVEVINAALGEVEEEIEEKAENIAKLIKSIDLDAAAIKEEETRLASKRKSLESRSKYLKEYLEGAMRAVDKPKIKGKLFSFNIQKNPPSIDVLDECLVPEEFFNIPAPVLDKKAVLARLKAGEEIPGVAIKQSESLRIR